MCKHVVFYMFKHISFDMYINIFICKQIDTSSTIKKKMHIIYVLFIIDSQVVMQI